MSRSTGDRVGGHTTSTAAQHAQQRRSHTMSDAGALVRDVSFAAFFPALLWDSWSHPETRTQATTWGLILHTAFWGSSSETLRRMLHGPSFFYAHGVLAG